MNRRGFIKNFLTAGVGAGLLARVPFIGAVRLPSTFHWSQRDDLDFANYIIETRIMPKYRSEWLAKDRAEYRPKRLPYISDILDTRCDRGRNLIIRNIKLYLDRVGPDRVQVFEQIIGKDLT